MLLLLDKTNFSYILWNYVYSSATDTTFWFRMFSFLALCALAGYLFGGINSSILVSKWLYRDDIRKHGSKNAGLTNIMRVYGKKAAAFTLIGDFLKTLIACTIGYVLMGPKGGYIAGLFCMLGHIFPIYFKFKGGKGVLSGAAMILCLDWQVFLVVLLIFILIVIGTKYVSLGSIMASLLYPLILDRMMKIRMGASGIEVTFALFGALIVVLTHRSNIKRLINHEENKFSFKKSVPKVNDDTQE